MALSLEMRNLINEMADEVIKLYDITIPINDIDDVVNRMNGIVKENPELDTFSDGRIMKKGTNSFVIEVSPKQSKERRNFTIAHEIGHLFLHMGFMTNDVKWSNQINVTYYRNGNSESEYQSNEFAAALLMPKKEYEKIMFENIEDNMVNITKIANYFHVSIDAASNRGRRLGYLRW
ncbi:MAG: ImmA/IrrE family metallo-endopeptidase [Eubacteriales bacterium]|nr:ImmA/IrrE family metallo-endopeptidase [Eubacteriales bacterium]